MTLTLQDLVERLTSHPLYQQGKGKNVLVMLEQEGVIGLREAMGTYVGKPYLQEPPTVVITTR